jgi:relaxase/mobilization nuclease domain protein
MATTKIWKVQKRLDHVIDYATNKEKTKNNYSEYGMDEFDSIRQVMTYATSPYKTEKQVYTTGINCEVKDAVKQMQFVKTIYGKENGILAFHAYQSFNEGEVTPEIAHEIGVKLANEMWGDRFQVVVSTHFNTQHLHNHFVINSVSFKDGKKYYSNLTNTALLRKTSDEICEEYGLNVLKEKTCKSGINFENFYKKSMRDSDYYKFAKEDIDYAIKHSYTLKQFQQMLVSMGYNYYYRADKLSVRREPYKRNIRVERAFGEEYSLENIKRRILENDYIRQERIIPYKVMGYRLFITRDKLRKKYKPKGIVALYYYYKYLLKLYTRNNIQYKLTPEMRAEVKKMDEYSERIRFLCKYKIETMSDVDNIKEQKNEELQKILNIRNRLYYKRQKLDSEIEKDGVTKEIINVTSGLTKVRKEIKLCYEIYYKVPKMKEQIKEVDEKEKQKIKEKEQEKKLKEKKKKDRRFER